MSGRITVMQVFSAIGVNPSRNVSWSVGARVAKMYQDEFGEPPPKDNRPKTTGAGTHCFALYPVTWQQRIEAVIREAEDVERSQFDLFEAES